MKTVCPTHQQAYEVDREVCPYCPPIRAFYAYQVQGQVHPDGFLHGRLLNNVTMLSYGIKNHPDHKVYPKDLVSVACDQIEARVRVPIAWGYPGTVVQVTVHLVLLPHVLAPVKRLTVPYKLSTSDYMNVCVKVHPDYTLNWVSLA